MASSMPCTARGGHITSRTTSCEREAQSTDRLQTAAHAGQSHAQVCFAPRQSFTACEGTE